MIAFHQVPFDNESKQFTPFSVVDRNYEYTRLQFGLATSPSVHQCLKSRVLQDWLGVISYWYIDDIVVYSRNHYEHLQQVFDRLRQAQLTLNLEKFYLMRSQACH